MEVRKCLSLISAVLIFVTAEGAEFRRRLATTFSWLSLPVAYRLGRPTAAAQAMTSCHSLAVGVHWALCEIPPLLYQQVSTTGNVRLVLFVRRSLAAQQGALAGTPVLRSWQCTSGESASSCSGRVQEGTSAPRVCWRRLGCFRNSLLRLQLGSNDSLAVWFSIATRYLKKLELS